MRMTCIENGPYNVSLIVGEMYEVEDTVLPENEGMVRVVDESGEEYLYPKEYFVIMAKDPDFRQLRKIGYNPK